jgi:hypothetical protein
LEPANCRKSEQAWEKPSDEKEKKEPEKIEDEKKPE